MDDKKIKSLEEKIDSIDKKIDKQSERISVIEKAVFSKDGIAEKDRTIKEEVLKKEISQKEYIRKEPENIFTDICEKKETSENKHLEQSEEIDLGVSFKKINFKKFEENIGKYVFQIIGVVLFILGMGFLFKYAIETGFFGPMARVILGFFAATVLLLGGEIYRRKTWAFGFIAGGIALYYITIYAAHTLYGLVSSEFAFMASITVTVLAFVLSLVHDSVFIASFSLVGGFLAPLFAGKVEFGIDSFRYFNPESSLLVFSYIFSLSLGFVILGLLKRWYVLPVSAILFIVLYFESPVMRSLELNYQLLNITIFFAIFSLVPYIYSLIFIKKDSWLEPVLLILSSACAFYFYYKYIDYAINIENLFAVTKINVAIWPVKWLFSGVKDFVVIKYLLLGLGLIYILKLLIMFARGIKEGVLFNTLFIGSVIQFFVVIVMHFQRFNLGISLQFYAIIIFMLGIIFKKLYIRFFAYCFMLCGIIIYYVKCFMFDLGAREVNFKSLVFNELNFATLILILIFGTSWYLLNRNSQVPDGDKKRLQKILELGLYFSIFTWFLSPIWSFTYSIFAIAIYSFLIYTIGLIYIKNYLKILSYLFFVADVFKFLIAKNIINFYVKLDALEKLNYYYDFNIVMGAFIVVLIFATFLVRRFEARLSEKEAKFSSKIYEFLICVFSFFCLGRNLYLLTEDSWFNLVAMSVYYGSAALIFIFLGLLLKRNWIRILGLFASGLTLWMLWFFVMSMKETVNRVVAFIVIGLIFMLVSFIYQKLSKK